MDSHDKVVDALKSEYPKVQQVELYFAADMKKEAQDKITAEAVKLASDNMLAQLPWVAGVNGSVSLDIIKREYESIPTASRKACGIRTRDKAYAGKMAGEQVTGCLNIVYKALGISEQDWKR